MSIVEKIESGVKAVEKFFTGIGEDVKSDVEGETGEVEGEPGEVEGEPGEVEQAAEKIAADATGVVEGDPEKQVDPASQTGLTGTGTAA